MSKENKTTNNKIIFTLADIAKVAEQSALSCYGVVDLSKSDSFRSEIREFLKKGSLNGANAFIGKNGYVIDLYIIVAFGVRVTEVVTEVQKKVKYDLEKQFKVPFKTINVFVQGVKDIN